MKQETLNLKEQQVQEIASKINESVATVVVEYVGLTVEEFKELRTELRAENVELQVIKNNISRRAFKSVDVDLDESLVGPTAVAFSKDDVTAAARVLKKFSKEHPALVLKAGTMDKKLATAEEVVALAGLPSRDGLLSMLLSVLQAPTRGLAQTLSQVADQKED